MKNASVYQKKIKKLLGGMKKRRVEFGSPPETPIALLLECLISPDTSARAVKTAMDSISREFVDFNELRVSPTKEIADRIGRNLPHSREKAETIVRVLNSVFDRTGTMTMDYMKEMSKKDLRRHLAEIGMSAYSAACLLLKGFDAVAVAVDCSLLDALKMNDCIHPDCQIEEATAFLERVIPQKDAPAAHEFFRELVEKNVKAIAKWRKAHPGLVSKPPQILPPPKFQMLAKSQPLPPMKGEEGYEGVVEVEAVAVEIEEEPEEVVEIEEAHGVEDIELPADDLEGPPAKPEIKPKDKKAKAAREARPVKTAKPSAPAKPQRKRSR
jgi:endonuclease III